MKIQTKLYLAFSAVFALVAVASIAILTNIIGMQNAFREFTTVQLRLARLADDVRYYDQVLTDAVRAYLIDPSDQSAYDRYYTTVPLLDQALLATQSLATSEEARHIFERINEVNLELVAMEEQLLANPDLETARTLFAGAYGNLKTQYSDSVLEFFDLQRNALVTADASILSLTGSALTITVAVVAALLVMCAIIAVILSRSILNPLQVLIGTTEQIAQGKLDAQLPPATRDELGELTLSIGTMVKRMHETLSAVEVRSRDLRAVSDVNAQISTLLNVDHLLHDVADLTKERFHLYHAHVYVVNEEGDTLVLAAGAGHVGRQMVSEVRTIELDNQQSIVARAAYTRKPVAVQDVTQSATFLPHPLLPDTKSELAVPLVARGQLLGVLDVQSGEVNYFTSEVIAVIQLMAGQIATALSNASLYEVADRTSRHERALGTIDRHIQSAADIDEILQVAVRELGKALRAPHTAIELRLGTSENDYAVKTRRLNGESQ